MGLTTTNFEGMLKQRYPGWVIHQLVYTERPLLALLPKDESFYGSVIKQPLLYGNPQNVSSTFARAQAGTSNSKVDGFLVTRKKNYGLATIQNELIEASASNEGAFLNALTTEINGAINAVANDISYQLFGSGTGKLGQINTSYSSGTTITLTNASDSVHFEVGMTLIASTTDGGGAQKNPCAISAIDRIAGTLTMAADVSGGGYSWAASDYLFRDGNYDQCVSGLDAWIPYDNRAARLAASFYNVTRNVDSLRLGGMYYDASSYSLEEGVVKGLTLCAREGGKPDYLFMNHEDIGNLINQLGSKVQRVQVSTEIKEEGKSMAVVGFDGIEIYYAGNKVKVLADRGCPVGRAFALQMDTWKLASLNKLVRLFEADGNKMLRTSNDDSVDVRVVSYSNLMTGAPGKNMQIKLA